MEFNIAVLPGDGIGPEVIAEGVKMLDAVAKRFGHSFRYTYDDVGGVAIDKHGMALKPETVEMVQGSDALLFGAVGGPKWDDPTAPVRPEDGLLAIRKGLGVFANIRPVKVFPDLGGLQRVEALCPGRCGHHVLIRELTGGVYYGLPRGRRETRKGWTAVDTMRYTQAEIERVLRVGFELAQRRSKRLASVDKANVLETSRLWRRLATEMSEAVPGCRA